MASSFERDVLEILDFLVERTNVRTEGEADEVKAKLNALRGEAPAEVSPVGPGVDVTVPPQEGEASGSWPSTP